MPKSKKEQSGEFDLLDPEVVGAVPNLRDPDGPGKPIHDAFALRQQLQNARKKVLAELNTTSGPGDFGSKIKFNAADDAAAVLAGVDAETLTAAVEESRRGSLLRQLRALEHALPIAEDKPRQLEFQIIPQICETLRPIAQDVVQCVLDACENLLVMLRTEAQFHELLRQKGVRADLRPGYMRPSPQAYAWLAGDIHRPPLSTFIKDRREAAGLDADAEKGK